MTVFISGGAKNGKSTFAQNLTLQLASGGVHYYVATMISTGKEDDLRIRRHLADRDGLGFETLECYKNVMDCVHVADKNGTFLVDSVTALVQNALFPVEKQFEPDLDGAYRCKDNLLTFAKSVRNAVFVSDYIYSDSERFSESTEMYRRCLAETDRSLAAICDTVIEVSAGQTIFYKGALPL